MMIAAGVRLVACIISANNVRDGVKRACVSRAASFGTFPFDIALTTTSHLASLLAICSHRPRDLTVSFLVLQ